MDDRIEKIFIIYKTNNDLKDVTIDYNEYKNAIEDIEKYRNIDLKKMLNQNQNHCHLLLKKSLIPKLKDDLSKTVL